ncbi:hypothetical protein NOF55_01655 [Rhizobiaceae bacterium BDR2-2]|uniref:EF-hand domain-containing protein n=1 Tax=Ectorhizobium quercum TaxID=2965071 RepID=A0AAE3MWZ1_9HYPH|nr:hypothetical protein [Ectorhizobium quercum]MCX8995806.1 hypothetical protein [Ectorhizobium quercum]
MNLKKIAIVAVGSALLAGGIAHAAPWDGERGGKRGHAHQAGPRGDMRSDAAFIHMLKLADADKDGKVTKEEADAAFLKIFDEIDGDKDGAVTPGEFRNYTQARMEEFRKNNPPPERAQANDADDQEQAQNDARPDRERPRGERHAERGDGPRGEGPRAEGPRGDGPRGEGRGWFGRDRGDREARPLRASLPLRHADTDENGQVSREEAKAFGDKIFARLDVNKDGVMSIDDLPDRPFP